VWPGGSLDAVAQACLQVQAGSPLSLDDSAESSCSFVADIKFKPSSYSTLSLPCAALIYMIAGNLSLPLPLPLPATPIAAVYKGGRWMATLVLLYHVAFAALCIVAPAMSLFDFTHPGDLLCTCTFR
jgi:hypothetical protein